MDSDFLLREAQTFAREELGRDSSGHDWWHVDRVAAVARVIASEEGANTFICVLAALLHDIADYKVAGSEEAGLRKVRVWLDAHGADRPTTDQVMEIISTMSFAGGNRPPMTTLEGRVVQDADRLDAIGAIGIARAFAYGGSRGRVIYEPGEATQHYASVEEYRANSGSSIAHFYEKLLLLKDRMNTPYARRLAAERHRFMEEFLDRFHQEWEGKG